MNQRQKWATVLAILACLAMAGAVWAGSSDGTAVDWSVLGGGGAPVASSSGAVTMNGTLGQTAIGPGASPHADLGAGFWYGLGARMYTIYLPIIVRNY